MLGTARQHSLKYCSSVTSLMRCNPRHYPSSSAARPLADILSTIITKWTQLVERAALTEKSDGKGGVSMTCANLYKVKPSLGSYKNK
uniref:Uncharacterized protein n=1 Tax=Anguilla anguilla TaxID=7936 RepID=A0A0E9WJE2_ANGAN